MERGTERGTYLGVAPISFQSELCVLAGDDPKRQPLLESLCAHVLESCNGLAEEESKINTSNDGKELLRFIFPAIVTDATLKACKFQVDDIKLSDGTIDLSTIQMDTVPYIRFRKSLVQTFPEGQFKNLKAANRARERTVFVVNADNLVTFLKMWDVQTKYFAVQKYASDLSLGSTYGSAMIENNP
jgi:hypothetical protein